MTGHVPDRDIRIEYIGLRPGEKLFEELLIDDAEAETAIEGVVRAPASPRDAGEIAELVDRLLETCHRGDRDALRDALLALVPEWRPSELFEASQPAARS
jgi:FlaA1/EpsC-like NDP-sugar epimerase